MRRNSDSLHHLRPLAFTSFEAELEQTRVLLPSHLYGFMVLSGLLLFGYIFSEK